MTRRLLSAFAILPLLSACTWVEMEPQGRAVRVAMAGEDLSGCERRGEITVSVRDRVAFVERNELKVRDELEVLARNDAARLEADTLQPASEPVAGEQRFIAYACRGTAARAAPATAPAATPDAADDTAETFPIRGD